MGTVDGPRGPTPDPAARAAVREAEQAVGDAWIGQLVTAEHAASVRAAESLRICCRLAERLRASRDAGDDERAGELRARLDRADRRSAEVTAEYDGVRDLLVRELQDWALATRGRIAASRADRADRGPGDR